ncbi:MAG: glycosyltransferase family 4 protein [Ignavibacteriales bacterium]|nr:glycosyltransferase family 4 protein [Ignavibacteriales bacterium]
MRICLIAESYPPALGGVEFALQQLVEGFVARGHQVRVIAASWEGHAPGVETRGSLTIERIRTLFFLKRFWFILFSIPGVVRGARWAEVVMGSTFAGGPPAFLGGWLAGRKKVLLVHEVYGKRWFRFEPNVVRALFYAITEWIIVRLPFDGYVAPSQYTKDSLCSVGVPERKITVIHHGDSKLPAVTVSREELRKKLGIGTDDFMFLAYGRTGVTKGIEYLVEAIPQVSAKASKAKFVLVLSGYDRRIWQNLQLAIGVIPSGICTFVPPVPRDGLAAYVAAADSVVVPSLSEGFGFSALEACNAGKIVVATDAGSLPEVVFGNHVFVKAGSADAIAEGCIKAINGQVDVTPVKNFSWEKAVGEYLGLYDGLLGGSGTEPKP